MISSQRSTEKIKGDSSAMGRVTSRPTISSNQATCMSFTANNAAPQIATKGEKHYQVTIFDYSWKRILLIYYRATLATIRNRSMWIISSKKAEEPKKKKEIRLLYRLAGKTGSWSGKNKPLARIVCQGFSRQVIHSARQLAKKDCKALTSGCSGWIEDEV